MNIGEKIKFLRKEKGWSQEELAKQINGDPTHISRYEKGKFIPAPAIIIKLAEAFNVSIDYLLLDNAERKSLKYRYEMEFLDKLNEMEELSEEDKNALLVFIEALTAKSKLKKIVNSMK